MSPFRLAIAAAALLAVVYFLVVGGGQIVAAIYVLDATGVLPFRKIIGGALMLGGLAAIIRVIARNHTAHLFTLAPLAALLLSGCLAGCASTGAVSTASANNALASLANNDLPTACGVITVAEGYFAAEKAHISAKNQQIEAQAAAAANVICANPPTNLASAFASLFAAWQAVQNATVTTN